MKEENMLDMGFFMFLLIIGVCLTPFIIGFFIILYAFIYLFSRMFQKWTIFLLISNI